MRDKSFEIGPQCKVAKRETLGGMYDKSRIVGGQPYQRMGGDYSKVSHAEHDKMPAQMARKVPDIGSALKLVGWVG